MLTTKLVIRILDPEEQLLGWAEAYAVARGDGTLWVERPTPIMIEVEGLPRYISVHWCDVNVETRATTDFTAAISTGNTLTMPGDWTAIVVGPMAGGLPPVTVRNNVAVMMPVGALGARAN